MSRQRIGLLIVSSLLTCLVGALLLSSSSRAASAIAGRDTPPTLSAGDRAFIEEAACGGMAEVVLGQLAQQKALSGQSGAAFDKQYMDAMVKDHEEDVAAFQKEAAQGKNMDLTSWVKNVLPTLQSHLTMALDTYDKVKSGCASSKGWRVQWEAERQAHQGKSQEPCSKDGRKERKRETEAHRHPHRKDGSESSGRNESERRSGLESERSRRPSPQP